jgi:hypothetical protein
MGKKFVWIAVVVLLFAPVAAFGQQTGTVSGKVVATDGSVLPGVTVEARSEVLPGPRVTATDATGVYRFPALPPGAYTITFTLTGMKTVTKPAAVQLAADTFVDATLGLSAVEETVTVVAMTSIVNRDAATIKSAVNSADIASLPLGQEYRDLMKLIPGVQVTQDGTRGPSGGGSGQDNVYQFDGVNVTLPLFGTLSAEPATHDIAQMTTTKGGARAIDFDRSGGFSVDSVSKSGTDRYRGQLGFQFQTHRMAEELKSGQISRFEQGRQWTDGNLGGPILKERAYFFASYFRPTTSRANRGNVYGPQPDYQATRNEGFGKVTVTPKAGALINFSWRRSHRFEQSDLFGTFSAPTTGTGNESTLNIGTLDGSWTIDSRSYVTVKFTRFANKTAGRPDHVASVEPSTEIGTLLDVNNLDTQGRLLVPVPVAGNATFNAFIQPLIDRYGFISETTGALTGGGLVGFGLEFNLQDFYRNAGQVGYNIAFGAVMRHDVHVGYQRQTDSEDLDRRSNGWGAISVPGGRTSFQGTPIFYTASFSQLGFKGLPSVIRSEYQSQSIEINDNIRWRDWSFNVGVLMSQDTLFGQGLREDPSTLSGYVAAPGNRYKMYEIPFSKMIQPRVGATFAYNGRDTVFASFARYNPAASSLPRAASWDRNLAATIDAHFDASGRLFGSSAVASSSGKLFVEDMTPRTINEVLVGTARELTRRLTGRIYGRFRNASHFWEDTNNNARVAFNPPEGIPRELYIADLDARRAQIGSGSTYVIADLDGAYTKYREVSLEAEWRAARMSVRGSYTWSHYFGNFDQDNTTTANDANVFMGSSFVADGAGRQLWDFRDGRLRGDRPHQFKIYGYRTLPWDATAGVIILAQSGQPFEKWSFEPYRALTTSTSDVSRLAEPAGSHRTSSHYQMDLHYTQNIKLAKRYTVQIAADVFNIGNRQTGYNIQNQFSLGGFGSPRSFWDPRRGQLEVRFS